MVVSFTEMDVRIFPIPHAFLEPGYFPIRRWHLCLVTEPGWAFVTALILKHGRGDTCVF